MCLLCLLNEIERRSSNVLLVFWIGIGEYAEACVRSGKTGSSMCKSGKGLHSSIDPAGLFIQYVCWKRLPVWESVWSDVWRLS